MYASCPKKCSDKPVLLESFEMVPSSPQSAAVNFVGSLRSKALQVKVLIVAQF